MQRPWALAWPAGLFLLITIFVAIDLVVDITDKVPAAHLIIESGALLLCLFGVIGTAYELRGALQRAHDLERDLDGTRADLLHWRSEAQGLLQGLGAVIDDQFARWALTSAEREVAILVLKGLSYKEIAEARGTTEHTARHQAFAIYRKAGVAGRAEMAAFFLEDLLLPRTAPSQRPAQ